MAKLVILGTSNAIADHEHDNTHMAVVGSGSVVLVDTGSNPVVRLPQAGLDLDRLTDMILTHFHPDHVSGVPLLLMDMWLMGRRKPLNIYGLDYTLDQVESLMGLYNWTRWPDFYPVFFHRIPEVEKALVLEYDDYSILSSPVHHLIPNIGLRFEFRQSKSILAYSCDTEPCEEVVNLAGGAKVLIHEASGLSRGHSSASQAGEIARRAEVGALYLIHYPTGGVDPYPMIREAKQAFPGEVVLAEDFQEIDP